MATHSCSGTVVGAVAGVFHWTTDASPARLSQSVPSHWTVYDSSALHMQSAASHRTVDDSSTLHNTSAALLSKTDASSTRLSQPGAAEAGAGVLTL